MKPNQLLSIVIPTFNRAELLDRCLEVHIPLAKAHGILIIISDNASTDATAEVVKKRTREYPLIHYHCSERNVGPDENFERALKYPQSKYVWLLGDTYQIPPDGISYILNLVTATDADYDVIVFNVVERVTDIPSNDYSDQNKLLSDLGWHMTCMASLVYSSELIANADFERYRNTSFIQTGVVFEHIANKKFLVHWVESLSVRGISVRGLVKESWQDQTFEIWIRRWSNFILSLPASYNLVAKFRCIKDHGHKTGIFTKQGLLSLRSANNFNYKIYRKYSDLFPMTIGPSRTSIFLIAVLPQTVAQTMKSLKRRLVSS